MLYLRNTLRYFINTSIKDTKESPFLSLSNNSKKYIKAISNVVRYSFLS